MSQALQVSSLSLSNSLLPCVSLVTEAGNLNINFLVFLVSRGGNSVLANEISAKVFWRGLEVIVLEKCLFFKFKERKIDTGVVIFVLCSSPSSGLECKCDAWR